MRTSTFTTLITAQTDPGLEQAFSRQAQIAQSSYATITRAATEASRATAGLLGGNASAGAGAATAAAQQRASAIRTAATAAAEGERASIRLATATRREADAVAAAARGHRGFAGSLTTTATALNVVSGRLDPVSSRISTLSRAVTDLTGVQLGLAAFGATLFALGRTANGYANLEARVRPFFDTQKQVNVAMNDIIGIAQRSRSALEPVVDVYTRLTTVGQNIGLSRSSISRVTEIATKAANLGGGPAASRDAALLQFGQGLSGDFKGAGQEINSLKEQAPILFQAILKGYKDVDGKIGISIGRLRELQMSSQLTSAGVLDALGRSSAYIDRMADRIPNTLSRAGTDFANSITITTGRFDQAIGFTSFLADGLSLASKNLRVLIDLAAGAGTAFAAIKLTGIAGQITSTVTGFFAARAAAVQLTDARVADARISQAQHQREVAALAAEGAEIRANIALLERKRAVAATDVARNAPGPGYAGSSRLASAAAQEEREAVRGLIQERQRLNIIQGASAAAAGRVTNASTVLAAAEAEVAGRTSLLRSVGGGLVNFFGGSWMIALTIATSAIYLLATAETQAERATRLHEDAQRSFANIIDRGTGKIYDQVDALQKLNIAKKNSADIDASGKAAKTAQTQIVDLLRSVSNPTNLQIGAIGALTGGVDPGLMASQRIGPQSDAAKRLNKAVEDFAAGSRGSYTNLANTVNELKNVIPGLAKIAPKVANLAGSPSRAGEEGSGFLGAYSKLRQGRAAQRVLQGRQQDGDVELALGNERLTSGASAARPKTKAQILAAAKAESASTELEKARANLVDVKVNRQAGEDDIAYQHRLAAAMDAVTAAENNQKAARAGASAGKAAARKEARDAIQDAKDEAAAKRDAALLNLQKQGLSPNSQAFLDQRIKILKTYDDEVNKLDESKAASSSAASQLIADAKRVAAAAATAGEKRRDVLAQYDEAPRALDKANDQIDDLSRFIDTAVDGVAFIGKTKDEIEAIKKINPLGTGIYTAEMADADAKRINAGVRKPYNDMLRDFQRGEDVARLVLQGRDSEAAALQQRNQLLDAGVTLSDSEYQVLVRNERQQLRINDALASRQRVVQAITGALDDARSTTETVLTDLQTGGNVGNVFKNAFASFRNQFAQIQSKQIVEKLFAGSDEKLRALLEGKSSVDTAISKFGTSVDSLTATSTKSETAVDRFANAVEAATSRINNTLSPAGGIGGGLVPDALKDALNPGSIPITTISGLVNKSLGLGGSSTDTSGDVVVQGRKAQPEIPLPTSVTPSAKEVYNTIGSSLFKPVTSLLDGLVNKVSGKTTVRSEDGTILGGSTFFNKIGDSFGNALSGAGKGAIASGFAQALGVKQNATGAAIGGGIGGVLSGISSISSALGPFGAALAPVLGILGGTLGNLFNKPKYGTASVSLNQYGEAVGGTGTGNSGAAAKAATGSAKSVADGINSIAQQLGATITNLPALTIGSFDGKARVATTNTSKSLNFNNFNDSNLKDFGKDGDAAAIQYAIEYSISHAVIDGISAASKKILASGQDLQQAISKATVIESIPKRLLQLTDPVKYAVSTLNDEFSKMISYLKEGGATAEQFADAQKLYDLERADAIKQATNQAADQISQFLKDMVGGTASPLNKKDTYQNAADDLAKFKSDIAAGKTVDQNDLLSAARNFQDASRALNGSSQSFFDDFDMLRSLLSKARDNAGNTDVTTLPASPFASDSTVQSAIASLQDKSVAATQAQTDALSGKLDTLISAVNANGTAGVASSSPGASAVKLLPGYNSQKLAAYQDY